MRNEGVDCELYVSSTDDVAQIAGFKPVARVKEAPPSLRQSDDATWTAIFAANVDWECIRDVRDGRKPDIFNAVGQVDGERGGRCCWRGKAESGCRC